MIVAASTVDRQPQEGLACGGHNVVKPVVAELRPVGRFVIPHAEPVVAGGDQSVVGRVGEFVAGDLFDRELVERLVGIERADQIVAVAPGMGLGTIAFKAVGFGIAHQIEPVAGPLLAVMGRGEQAVDHLLKRLWRRIGEKVFQFGLRGGEAGEIVGGPPQQRGFVGRQGNRQAAAGQPSTNESVDRMGRILHLRHGRARERPESPMLLPGGPLFDPIAEGLDLRWSEPRSFRRHADIGIGGCDALEDQARLLVTSHDSSAAAFQFGQGASRFIQPQPPLLLVGAMAGKTFAGQQRLDLAGEVDRSRLQRQTDNARNARNSPHDRYQSRPPTELGWRRRGTEGFF